jgi:hypothetical protein
MCTLLNEVFSVANIFAKTGSPEGFSEGKNYLRGWSNDVDIQQKKNDVKYEKYAA